MSDGERMKADKSYDVVVVGGGVSGVAAAVAAARAGATTAVIEKQICLGGLATAGGVPIYLCLCDGEGNQVTSGIAEELIAASIRYGPGRVPDAWRDRIPQSLPFAPPYYCDTLYPNANLDDRFMSIFSPHSFILGLDEFVESESIDVWFDTLFTRPRLEGDRIVGIEVENASGRIYLSCKCAVDATGDAHLAARCGADCEENGSYPTYLYHVVDYERVPENARSSPAAVGRLLGFSGIGGKELEDGNAEAGRRYIPSDGADVSEFVRLSRRIARQKLTERQNKLGPGGRELIYPAALPLQPQFRRGRRIRGCETIRTEDKGKRMESAIGVISDCRTHGDVWEVPYGALLPRGVSGLLVAGRCCSASDYAWHVSRLIPPAVLTGQIAGIAAALSISEKTAPHELSVAAIQNAAEKACVKIHIPGEPNE